jgi:hypothetical protein
MVRHFLRCAPRVIRELCGSIKIGFKRGNSCSDLVGKFVDTAGDVVWI